MHGRPADHTSPCDGSVAPSPLLPAEVVTAPEDQEEAQDSREDDRVSREDQCAGSPLDLRQEERHSQQARKPGRRGAKPSWRWVLASHHHYKVTCNDN